MHPTRLTICAAALAFFSTAAAAAPAYVKSTVNLRSGAGTTNEILTKIPAGSLVDAGTCSDGWCEIDWQGKKGYAIQTAIDTSGRVPGAGASAPGPRAYAGPPVRRRIYVDDDPPVYYVRPRPYYYGYPYYRPYWGYRRAWRYW
ncbi:MAG: hypothetical protein FJX62_23110 [Alphaproteobacteria bacterium]|nr:hypothetical protein [Alphaproteobacteria bacterium]